MENIIFYGAYIFSISIVLIFSAKEFNGPSYSYDEELETSVDLSEKSKYARLAKPTLPKYMTDTSVYTAFMIGFSIFSAVIYLLFTQLLMKIPDFGLLLGDGQNNEALAAILSLMLYIGIVKSDDIKHKSIQNFIKWPKVIIFGLVKDWLHDKARIPGFGCDIFDSLCYKDIDIKSPLVDQNIKALLKLNHEDGGEKNKYIRDNDFHLTTNQNDLISRWARLSYLMFLIGKWANDNKYKNHIEERSLRWNKLESAYNQLITNVISYRDKDVEMSQDEETELSQNVDDLLANCYRLISCVVIMTAKPTEDPLCYIKNLGFVVSPDEKLFSRKGEMFRVAFAIIPIISILVLLFTLYDSSDNTTVAIQNALKYILASFVIMVLPLALVRSLKRKMMKTRTWNYVSNDSKNTPFFDRPLFIYSSISILSWGISLLLMMLLLSKKGISASDIEAWKSMASFCFISAITAFITAYRTDTPPLIYNKVSSYYYGISKVPLVHGSLTSFTIWLGMNLSQSEKFTESQVWQFPLLGFCISLVIGFTLYKGKHKINRRNTGTRTSCKEQVTLVQGTNVLPATLINKHDNGVMLIINHAYSMLKKNHNIEIIFEDGMQKFGSIVTSNLSRVNISYNT